MSFLSFKLGLSNIFLIYSNKYKLNFGYFTFIFSKLCKYYPIILTLYLHESLVLKQLYSNKQQFKNKQKTNTF